MKTINRNKTVKLTNLTKLTTEEATALVQSELQNLLDVVPVLLREQYIKADEIADFAPTVDTLNSLDELYFEAEEKGEDQEAGTYFGMARFVAACLFAQKAELEEALYEAHHAKLAFVGVNP